MHETADDLVDLQRLLDESYAAAGNHLRRIFTEERRVAADRLPAELTGVQVLSLATVTAAGEPRVGPVDGLFFRGRLHFGSAHDSARFRNLRARPAVSAAVIRGESFAVIVHGTARELDMGAPEQQGFGDYCREVYGEGWEQWAADSPYARIEPVKMFTFGAG